MKMPQLSLMTLLAMFVCFLFTESAQAVDSVVVEGKTEVCHSKEIATRLAETSARNNASDACAGIGARRLGKIIFAGYMQCNPCGSKEYSCVVKQVGYHCVMPTPPKDTSNKGNNPEDAHSGTNHDKSRTPNEKHIGSSALESIAESSRDPSAPGSILQSYADERKRIANKPVRINYPSTGLRVSSRVIDLSGDTYGFVVNNELDVFVGDTKQHASTDGSGNFRTKVVLRSGENTIRVCFDERCTSTRVIADVAKTSFIATLSWQGGGDLDLHAEGPRAISCNFSRKTSPDCSLDIDDQRGRAPENISIPSSAPEGEYTFKVVNFSGTQASRATLTIYKNESLVFSKDFDASGSSKSTVFSTKLSK